MHAPSHSLALSHAPLRLLVCLRLLVLPLVVVSLAACSGSFPTGFCGRRACPGFERRMFSSDLGKSGPRGDVTATVDAMGGDGASRDASAGRASALR